MCMLVFKMFMGQNREVIITIRRERYDVHTIASISHILLGVSYS